MIKKKTYIDLLADNGFKDWVLNPNFERNLFWEKQLKNDHDLQKEVKKARELIFRLQFKQKKLDADEKNEILEKIISGNSKVSKQNINKKTFFKSGASNVYFMKVAASLLLIFAVGYLFYLNEEGEKETLDKNQPVTQIVKNNPKGVKKSVGLPDGSKVKVNANSEIRFPYSFSQSNERVVYLKGEAYFEIKRLESKPFKVLTEKAEIEVLGTSFDVRSFPNDNKEYIAVSSGKVGVKNETGEVTLLPNEMAVIEDGKITKMPFDRDEMFSWKDGILYYKDANFNEVLKKLEYWYGVEFEVEGVKEGLTQFSGKYDNKPLSAVLAGLSFAASFKYEINGKKVKVNF